MHEILLGYLKRMHALILAGLHCNWNRVPYLRREARTEKEDLFGIAVAMWPNLDGHYFPQRITPKSQLIK